MLTFATIYDYKLSYNLLAIGEKLGNWAKPQSTNYFSYLLLAEYDDYRWIQYFHMSKDTF